MAQKTILINIFDSNMARNILRTDVLGVLKKEKNLKIVLLVPKSKENAYAEEFISENVTVDILPTEPTSKLERFAFFVARNSIPAYSIRQVQKRGLAGTDMKKHRYFAARIFWFLGHVYFWRFLVAKIGYLFFNEKVFEELLKKHNPDLIFSPTIYANNDLRLLKYAKKNSILVAGMIKSWDNLTTKDPLLIHPNRLIVHNKIIKNEAVGIGHYPEENIFVSGIPQFDVYADENFTNTKEEFFGRLNLDPNKKLILYSAVGPNTLRDESDLIHFLANIVNSGKLKYSSQLLVRLHPAFLTDEEKFQSIPNVVVDRPGKFVSSTKTALRDGWEFDREDTRHLADTLKWSDVAINGGSTMTIEAAIFNRPIINIAFNVVKQDDYLKSAEVIFKRDHLRPVVDSGGVKIVHNETELVNAINTYLENPKLDEVGRKKIVKEQCFKLDGKSGERIANFLLGLLEKQKFANV